MPNPVQRSANQRWLSLCRPAGLVPNKSAARCRFNSTAAPPPGHSQHEIGGAGQQHAVRLHAGMMRDTSERSASVRAGIHSAVRDRQRDQRQRLQPPDDLLLQ
jgi:hypothetical protein